MTSYYTLLMAGCKRNTVMADLWAFSRHPAAMANERQPAIVLWGSVEIGAAPYFQWLTCCCCINHWGNFDPSRYKWVWAVSNSRHPPGMEQTQRVSRSIPQHHHAVNVQCGPLRGLKSSVSVCSDVAASFHCGFHHKCVHCKEWNPQWKIGGTFAT